MGDLAGRDIISIDDLGRETILYVLEHARRMAKEAPIDLLDGRVMASLFFEPSTRTRLSFETAMNRLGGRVVGFADASVSSRYSPTRVASLPGANYDFARLAVDASGVREVVRDRYNGRLLPWEDVEEFVAALSWLAALSVEERRRLDAGIVETADRYSMSCTAQQALALYEAQVSVGPTEKRLEGSLWATARRRLEEEWKIFKNLAAAAGGAWLRVGGVREGWEAERAG